MKRISTLIMAVVMVVSLSSVVFAKYDTKGAIAHYTFDNGADKGLTVKGDNVKFADGKAEFGEASWIESDVNLKDLTEITVALKIKGPAVGTEKSAWAFEITSEAQHAADTTDGSSKSEHYLGAFFNQGSKCEYIDANAHANTDGDRPQATWVKQTDGEFMEYVLTYSNADHTLRVYVNGEQGDPDNMNRVLSNKEGAKFDLADMLGKNPLLKFGKANWGKDGEFGVGIVLDEVAVYNYALSADQVKTAFNVGEIVTPATSGNGNGGASQTGVATVALAIAAISSGAYVVSKKRH